MVIQGAAAMTLVMTMVTMTISAISLLSSCFLSFSLGYMGSHMHIQALVINHYYDLFTPKPSPDLSFLHMHSGQIYSCCTYLMMIKKSFTNCEKIRVQSCHTLHAMGLLIVRLTSMAKSTSSRIIATSLSIKKRYFLVK